MNSVRERLGCAQGRRDTLAEKQLAKELVDAGDMAGFKELAENLRHPDQRIRSRCLKVLYEAGFLAPKFLEPYANEFLELVGGTNNRMVWGGMIALAAVAKSKAAVVWPRLDGVIRAIEKGTVITQLWGVRVLAGVAAANTQYARKTVPAIMKVIASCIPRDVPTHAQSALPAIDSTSKDEFLALLEKRRKELSSSQLVKLRKVVAAVR